jgi:hypothetical protein
MPKKLQGKVGILNAEAVPWLPTFRQPFPIPHQVGALSLLLSIFKLYINFTKRSTWNTSPICVMFHVEHYSGFSPPSTPPPPAR